MDDVYKAAVYLLEQVDKDCAPCLLVDYCGKDETPFRDLVKMLMHSPMCNSSIDTDIILY